jgi:hypothetical protein
MATMIDEKKEIAYNGIHSFFAELNLSKTLSDMLIAYCKLQYSTGALDMMETIEQIERDRQQGINS